MNMDALDPHQVEYITDYAKLWIAGVAPNQALRIDGDTLSVQVGHGTFAAARQGWEAIK